jgi:hypothetical protein
MRRMPAAEVAAAGVVAAGAAVAAGTPAVARRPAVGSPHERRYEDRRLKLGNQLLARRRQGGMHAVSARKNAGTTGIRYVTIVRISSKTDGMIITVIVAGQLSRPAWL